MFLLWFISHRCLFTISIGKRPLKPTNLVGWGIPGSWNGGGYLPDQIFPKKSIQIIQKVIQKVVQRVIGYTGKMGSAGVVKGVQQGPKIGQKYSSRSGIKVE